MRHPLRPALFAACALAVSAHGALTNRADRLEWFRDQGFGLFIHWNVDCQLGVVISHSLVGATDDYVRRHFEELPRTFNPRKFHPDDWAVLARLAGVRYVVFTAKHHSGFCLWPTDTTDYNIRNTPFARDLLGETLAAFRARNIATGLYFSPDDFWWLHQNGIPLQRGTPAVQPANNPGLMQHDLAQVRELFTRYGDIAVVFFDGEAEQLRDLAWQLQPDTVVTRGALNTPELYLPGQAADEPWEACFTMGRAWGYQPTREQYKSGGQIIAMLIETRAKGGNLLLNVGPKPDGEWPIEQEERLREVALWMFVNGEAIYGVRPWILTHEGDCWFTRRKEEDTVYVFLKNQHPWKLGAWREFTFRSLRATDQTTASVLGQNDAVLEYHPHVIPKTTWQQTADGLRVRAMRAQRLSDDRLWPNPVVLKLTHVQPALRVARVETLRSRWQAEALRLTGAVRDLGSATAVEAGFEYRDITGMDTHERTGAWQRTAFQPVGTPGEFSVQVPGLSRAAAYEFRAVVRHTGLDFFGAEKKAAKP